MAGITIEISEKIKAKLLDRHNVTVKEAKECFYNRKGEFLEDEREDHKTDPPTLWFISKTNKGRVLSVFFMLIGSEIHIKSAFEPNAKKVQVYKKLAGDY